MPIPAEATANMSELNSRQKIDEYLYSETSRYVPIDATDYGIYELPFLDSSRLSTGNPYPEVGNIYNSDLDKKFIHIRNLFKVQFDLLKDYFCDVSFEKANEKLSSSLSGLLEINPDNISMEVTYDQSIFYTVKKGEYIFFIEHFLDTINDDEDEAILTVFKGDDKLPSYAGNLYETLREINVVLINNTLKPQVELV